MKHAIPDTQMIRENIFSETIATALRTYQYSRTSSVITWLTSERGMVSTIVKGSYRPKSEFLGQHDLFYTCELIYYDRDRNGLHVAKEFTPVKTRTGIRDCWRSATLASYISSLLCESVQNDPHSSELYDLANLAFDFLDQSDANLQLLFWFELQYLGCLGFAPHLANCSRCGGTFQASKPVSFSVSDGGLRCSTCGHTSSSTGRGPSPLIIQPDTLAVLRNWQKTGSPRTAQNTKCSPAQTGEISALLKSFLDFHVAFQGESRNIAVKLLRTKKKRKN